MRVCKVTWNESPWATMGRLHEMILSSRGSMLGGEYDTAENTVYLGSFRNSLNTFMIVTIQRGISVQWYCNNGFQERGTSI